MKIYRWGILYRIGLISLIAQSTFAAQPAHFEFSLKVLQNLLKSSGGTNLVFSPLGIRHALGIAGLGARGRTKAQLGKAPDLWPIRKYKLQLASRIWLQAGIPVPEEFMKASEELYDQRPWFVDFTQAPDFLKNRVNRWMEERTSGKIRDLINEDSVDSSMKMMLSSAVYFKGEWVKAFDLANSKVGTFLAPGNVSVKAQYMRTTGNFNYFANNNVQAVELPYQEGDVSMLLFLPTSGQDLGDLEDSMKAVPLDFWTSHMALREVSVVLPKFEFDSTVELSEVLKNIGAGDAFIPGVADFQGMTHRRDVVLNRLYHKTFISANELGTEGGSIGVGSAVSATREPASSPLFFEATHPFLFGVWHRTTKTWIFLGRVAKPSAPVEES